MLIVLDGIADRQHPSLYGRTPLQAAHTPNLDALAREGACGVMHVLGPGRAPTSYQAHFAMFGYPPRRFPGRGLFEAIGCGLPPEPGEVVLRASLIAVGRDRKGRYVVTRRPDPRTGESTLGEVDLDATIDGVDVRFVHTDARQGLVFLRSDAESLSHEVTDADPFAEGLPVLAVQPFEEALDQEGAARTARVLNAWMLEAHRRLGGAAFVVVKWAGAHTGVQPFEERYGMEGAVVASGPLYAGLAGFLGMRHVETGCDLRDPRRDLEQRIERALGLIEEGVEFVHVHTKAPDHAAHRKDPERKREVIERCDEALARITEVRPWERGVVVAVTADHATPSAGPLYHSGEAVPLTIVGGAVGRDDVGAFSEDACRRGRLGQLTGADLMPVLLNVADRCVSTGERFTRARQFARVREAELVPLLDRVHDGPTQGGDR